MSPSRGNIFLITTSTKPAGAASFEVYRVVSCHKLEGLAGLVLYLISGPNIALVMKYEERYDRCMRLAVYNAWLVFGSEDGSRTFILSAVEIQRE